MHSYNENFFNDYNTCIPHETGSKDDILLFVRKYVFKSAIRNFIYGRIKWKVQKINFYEEIRYCQEIAKSLETLGMDAGFTLRMSLKNLTAAYEELRNENYDFVRKIHNQSMNSSANLLETVLAVSAMKYKEETNV